MEKILNYIEDEQVIMDDFYYHAFSYNHEKFINMITEGIKSPILLKTKAGGNNGYFYVSLTKNENCKNSIYKKLDHMPMFIINNKIKTVKAKNFSLSSSYPMWVKNSPLPFRDCEYDDEYQKFLKVNPKDILGIIYDISNCDNPYLHDIKNKLFILNEMIKDLKSENINLPIINASSNKKINQEKVLSLF